MSQFDELPDGWELSKLGDLTEPSKEKVEPSATEESIYIGLEHIEKDTAQINGYGSSKEVKSTKSEFNKGDLLYGKLRPYLNKVYLSEFDGICSTDILVFPGSKNFLNKYLKYCFLSPDFIRYANQNMTGVQHPRVHYKDLAQFPISLPPFNEQRRIVEKIEELTARSRKARTALDEIPALFDQFRQSVLAAAFRGDLTVDWRAQNPNVETAEALLERIRVDLDRRKDPKKVDASKLFDIPETWSWVSLEAIATHKSGVAFKSKDFIQEGVQVIRLGNVYKGKLDLARDPVFLPPLCLEENFNLMPGCIVVSQTGTRFKKDYGNFVLIPSNSPKLLLNQRLLAVYCHPLIDPEYVVFASKLEAYKNHFFASETGGVNQGNVGVSGVMEGPIPLAPIEEIKEVIQKIKDSFLAIDLLEELLIENQHELEQLDQSILAKAFRGELVPQDPKDEPAAVLLDRIRAEREQLGSSKKRGKAKA